MLTQRGRRTAAAIAVVAIPLNQLRPAPGKGNQLVRHYTEKCTQANPAGTLRCGRIGRHDVGNGNQLAESTDNKTYVTEYARPVKGGGREAFRIYKQF